MKTRKSTMKKVLSAAAALLLISVTQVQADTAHFDGIINWDDLGLGSVSLDLEWTSFSGTGFVTFDPAANTNTISFSGGSLLFTERDRWIDPDPLWSDALPEAHFTNGVLDGVYMNYFEVAPGYGVNVAWNYDANDPIFTGAGSGSSFSILDVWTDQVTDGSFADPTTSAVPVPGAVWLLGSGLVGLAQIRRKSNK